MSHLHILAIRLFLTNSRIYIILYSNYKYRSKKGDLQNFYFSFVNSILCFVKSVVGYIFAILMPMVGVIIGICSLFKNAGHGFAIIALSLLSWIIWYQVLMSM